MVKNLVFLAKVLKLLTTRTVVAATTDEDDDTADKQPTLTWLVKRMMRMARTETAVNAKQTLKVGLISILGLI